MVVGLAFWNAAQIKGMERAIEALRPALSELALQREIETAEQVLSKAITDIDHKNVQVVRLLETISTTLPDRIVLTQLEFKAPAVIKIKGLVLTQAQGAEAVVLGWIDRAKLFHESTPLLEFSAIPRSSRLTPFTLDAELELGG